MEFVELPSYAEARDSGYHLLEEYDNGMGDTVGMIEDHLIEEADARAESLDVEYILEPGRFDILVSGDENVALLYDEFYEASRLAILGATIFECPSDSAYGKGGVDEGSQEFRVPTNGGDVLVDEQNLRSAADFHY